VTLARTLLQLSSIVFAVVGIGYLGAPGLATAGILDGDVLMTTR
jgi:hypothetical protein